MVDTLALGASAERRGGSSPLSRTKEMTGFSYPVISLVYDGLSLPTRRVEVRGAKALPEASFENA